MPRVPASRSLHDAGAPPGRRRAVHARTAVSDRRLHRARHRGADGAPPRRRRHAVGRARRRHARARGRAGRASRARGSTTCTTRSSTRCGEEAGRRARTGAWRDAFPPAYQDEVDAGRRGRATSPCSSASIPTATSQLRLEPPNGDGVAHIKLYRAGAPLVLSDVMPLLEHLGVTVVDEHPYEIAAPDGPRGIYSFGVVAAAGDPLADPATQARVADVFLGVWAGTVENDGLNRLVLHAGLEVRDVVIVRALCQYLRQAGVRFTDAYLADTLHDNAEVVRLLVACFHARLDPGSRPRRRRARGEPSPTSSARAIDAVVSLDADRILRALVAGRAARRSAPTRTGARRTWRASSTRPALDFLPRPQPQHEIWVASPPVEGVHLRAGDIARGGIRWSDRREDFRTEVLGLMKAQTVKNAVIVPVGAKGGFYVKRGRLEGRALPDVHPRPARAHRQPGRCGRAQVVPPPGVVRRDDGDDSVPRRRGRQGHRRVLRRRQRARRRVRLLARRRVRVGRFRRVRPQGDGHHVARRVALGEGALPCARHRRRHRPPDGRRHRRHVGRRVRQRPAAVTARAARRRVRPPSRVRRSRSRSGGVVRGAAAAVRAADLVVGRLRPRGALRRAAACTRARAKSVDLSAAARRVLGIDDGDRLVAHARRGGERDPAGAGRPALERRDRHVREGVDRDRTPTSATAPTTRCASTPPSCGAGSSARAATSGSPSAARVEYALAGGRINTDAIDNSAGVDTSDHEVNIKILLQRAIAAGALAADAARPAARRHDRRGRRPRAGRQRGPGERAGDRRGRGARSGRGARASDGAARADRRTRPRARRRCRAPRCCRNGTPPGSGSPRPSSRCCWRTPSSSCSARSSRPTCPTTRTCTTDFVDVLPAVAPHRLRRRARVAPAAPRDRGHRRRQRGREPRRDQLPVAPVRRDRLVAAGAGSARTSSRATCSTPPTRGPRSTRSTSWSPRRCRTRCSSSSADWSSGRRAGWCATRSRSALGPTVERFRPGVRAVAAALPELLVGSVADAAATTAARFVDAGVAPELARRVATSDAALVALPAVALALEHDLDADDRRADPVPARRPARPRSAARPHRRVAARRPVADRGPRRAPRRLLRVAARADRRA